MKEIWKPVKGYEGLYDISNMGSVRSYYAPGGKKLSECASEKTISFIRSGRNYIHLFKNGKERCVSVSRLVAEAFLEKPVNAIKVKHLDGNIENNRVDNLIWLSK